MVKRLCGALLGLGGFAAALLAVAAPADAAWLKAETAHFVVHSDSGEARLRAQAAELEDFHRLLRQLTATADPEGAPKLNIYMVDGPGELRQVWPGAGHGIAGFYTASPEGILAVVDPSAGRGWNGRNETLFHEYAHHFMLQHFPAVYPQWYIEGFAEYVATARFEDGTIEYGRTNPARASWIADRSGWLPLDQLLFTNPERLTGRPAAQFYAQSWILVHYMLRDGERMRRLNAYLTAVGRGQPPRAAFEQAFGATVTQVQRQLMSYTSGGMSFTRLTRPASWQPAAVTLAPLPASADDLLLLDASMTAGAEYEGDAFVRRIRRAAGDAPDAFARRVLARAEALHGDGAAAERLLTELLAASPDDAELLYLMGMRHLRAGRADAANRASHFRTAQRWFGRAHRADENHYPTLYRYAESLSHDPAALLSENTTNILLLAQQIAPQAHMLRLSAANLLMRRGRWEEAEAMLLPLASHAHAGAMMHTARSLLEKTRARSLEGVPGVFDRPQAGE
jgi:tetratricopeptide (TPR) repeat protein